MAASSIWVGQGCTREVGMDLKNLRAKKIMVVSDANVSKLHAIKQVLQALDEEDVNYVCTL